MCHIPSALGQHDPDCRWTVTCIMSWRSAVISSASRRCPMGSSSAMEPLLASVTGKRSSAVILEVHRSSESRKLVLLNSRSDPCLICHGTHRSTCESDAADGSTPDGGLTEIVVTEPLIGSQEQRSDAEVTTKLHAEGICCASEAALIHRILRNLPGVSEVHDQPL